jgi:hypothetical protein
VTRPQESKRNQMKDFVNIAGPLGVTHFLMLTATENASYLRVAKSPQVPLSPSHCPAARGRCFAPSMCCAAEVFTGCRFCVFFGGSADRVRG